MRHPALIGFLIGLFCTFLWFAPIIFRLDFGDPPNESLLRDFLVWISTPVAYVVSWIIGWPLQQEAAIFIYVFFAIPITLPLLGLTLGFIYSRVKYLISKRLKN
jgi:hypothetical protein